VISIIAELKHKSANIF